MQKIKLSEAKIILYKAKTLMIEEKVKINYAHKLNISLTNIDIFIIIPFI